MIESSRFGGKVLKVEGNEGTLESVWIVAN
jgi:hypothetical protein